MKKKVKLRIRAGGLLNDPKVLFNKLPYILDRFDFQDSDDFEYVLYYNKQQVPPVCNATKIFLAREYRQIDMRKTDWALGAQYTTPYKNDKYLRYPNYVYHGAGTNLIKPHTYNPEEIYSKKSKFCAFVCRHDVNFRNSFFDALAKYKRVDSPGSSRNNTAPIGNFKNPNASRYSPNMYQEQVEYYKQFKFAICFENLYGDGFTSERIYYAMLANCIPIYWGNPRVNLDFNTSSFVNFPDFAGSGSTHAQFARVIERIRYLDSNRNAYLEMLSQPWYNNNRLSQFVDPKIITGFFDRVFSGDSK